MVKACRNNPTKYSELTFEQRQKIEKILNLFVNKSKTRRDFLVLLTTETVLVEEVKKQLTQMCNYFINLDHQKVITKTSEL